MEVVESPCANVIYQLGYCSSQPSWKDPIITYLHDIVLLDDKFEARRLRFMYAYYFLQNDKLYKRSFSFLSLVCLEENQAHYTIREFHKGIYGNHTSSQALAHRVLHQGYRPSKMTPLIFSASTTSASIFLLFLINLLKTSLQFPTLGLSSIPHLTSISNPLPFIKWGIDLIGPLSKARG